LAGTDVNEDDVFYKTGVVLPTDPDDFLGCFQVAMVDMATKVQLGSGIDCLYDIPGGAAAVSFFMLPGRAPRRGVGAVDNWLGLATATSQA
jgi:hypothetical protein